MGETELVNKVKTRIDEVCASGDTIVEVGVENTKPYDSIIKELLDESAIEVLLKAPFYRLPITTDKTEKGTPDIGKKVTMASLVGSGTSTTTVTENATLPTGTINLPTNFLRLVSFKMADWTVPVYKFEMPDSEIAKRQAYRHLRGGVNKPVAVLYKNSTNIYVRYYSVNESSTEHKIDELRYIQVKSATELTDSQVIDAMCWICAGKTLGVLGENALANQCYENAKGLML